MKEIKKYLKKNCKPFSSKEENAQIRKIINKDTIVQLEPDFEFKTIAQRLVDMTKDVIEAEELLKRVWIAAKTNQNGRISEVYPDIEQYLAKRKLI